jgi:hypothetical protein
MSAARSRHNQPTPGSPGQSSVPLLLPAGNRRVAVFVLVLAAGWSLALLLMVVTTTGRPVVGPGQLLKSDVIVIGKYIQASSDQIEVERVFQGNVEQGEKLRVTNLGDTSGLVPGRSYIFPLSRSRNDFSITRLEGQREETKLLVYPANPDTIDQTKVILREAGR